MDVQDIIIRLEEYRKAKGLKMYEMAEIMGVSKTSYSNWVNGWKHPRFKKIVKIENLIKEFEKNNK